MIVSIAKEPKVRIQIAIDGKNKVVKSRLASDKEFCVEFLEHSSDAIVEWLANYAAKKPSSFPLLLQTPSYPDFSKHALKALSQVPFGETLSYGELATKAGNKGASRAAGTVCGNNLFPLIIPCHRILKADKKIGGFAFDLVLKKRLLDFEEAIYQ